MIPLSVCTWQSPLFLLFLDTTWQLLEQYPAAFEFSETYLAVLCDSTRISLFGTFLFNSPHQRVKQSTVSDMLAAAAVCVYACVPFVCSIHVCMYSHVHACEGLKLILVSSLVTFYSVFLRQVIQNTELPVLSYLVSQLATGILTIIMCTLSTSHGRYMVGHMAATGVGLHL